MKTVTKVTLTALGVIAVAVGGNVLLATQGPGDLPECDLAP